MRSLILLPALAMIQPALAAETAVEVQDPDWVEDDSSIVVVATRIRGQVETEQPPIMTLDEEDVAAYGANSLGELLEAVSPQTGSGRGRGGGHPLILLNGQRISSWRQLRGIPPEAIRRMEVLPEEVALRFGARPDQRVVNFILKENFATVLVAGEYNVPTRGGYDNSELEAGLVRFDGPSRINLSWKMVDDTLLTEAERDLVQPDGATPDVSGDPDPAAFRSLVADSVEHEIKGSWSNGLGKDGLGGSLTVDGQFKRTDSLSLSGLDTVVLTAPDGSSALRSLGGALERDTRVDALEGGLALNLPIGRWQFTATTDLSHTDTQSRIDRRADLSGLVEAAASGALAIDGALPAIADPGFDTAREKELALSSLGTLSGQPFRLPAGEASLTLDAGYDHLANTSRDTRGTGERVKLTRDVVSAGANLSLPLTSRREDVAAAIGDITLNLNGGVEHYSDFGTLADWSVGLTWSPVEALTLQASYIYAEAAPSLTNLGAPETLTLNVPTYDFTRDETVLASIVSGGNPLLLAEKQRDIKLSASLDLPFFRRSSLLVEYFRNSSDDVTRSFPLLTPAVEAAFPGRVTRDAGGQLLAIDRRPVTFSKVEGSRMRWGVNFSGRVASENAPPGERRGGGSPFGGRGHGGRWNVSAYHTWRLSDDVTVAPDVPVFDQLAGNALTDGGVPRHSLELEGGVFHKGMGIRLKGEWDAPARVLSNGAPGASDLRFGSVFKVNARIFINLGQQQELVDKAPFLKGLRVAFDFSNILDSRQKVTDESGAIPLAYQRAYRDPTGRVIGIDIKKSF